MTKRIVRVTKSKEEAHQIAKRITASLRERNINREAYVSPVSYSYVRTLTRKGYPIAKKNYGVCVRNRLKRVM